MTSNAVVLPFIVHLFTAILLLFFWRKTVAQRIISVMGSTLALTVAIGLFSSVWNDGILTMQAAGWAAPFGISFVADVFSSSMVLLTSFSGLAVAVYSATGISRGRMLFGYFPMFHFLLMGLNGAYLTGDIFNLYVWFEVIIIASFVLMSLGGRKAQIEGSVKYMAMNILASTFFLTGIGILYGITGSLNIADLSLKVGAMENRKLVDMTAIFFIVGFGIKSAVFPLYFWLPSSYHTPPSAVAAIFGGLLTKVGIYALFRIFTLIFVPDDFLSNLLIVLAVLTVLTGTFGAVIKNNIRRLLSYLIVCHIGFMVGGLGMYSEVALAGALFYLFHDMMVKTNIFLIAGLIRKLRGTMNMDKIGGLYAEYPLLSLLMAVVLFSLVGIPPLSGFWPKIYLFEAGFMDHHYALVAAIIIGSFATLYVIAKMWAKVFWKSQPEGIAGVEDGFRPMSNFRRSLLVGPIVFLAAITLFIGLGAEHIVTVVNHIVREMKDTSPYIQAVLEMHVSP
ncbi:multicomponent Na+:H+ antiporter subunit D [Parapedobacter composti]|uniref:Multicomponent Na+:H+ antiporter subunit D n=1 Tax=Parapedobacter composti TaxID=623281 RepID=A0A1I1EZE0_9SPHI|nr:proton-conducting transporter membrane subunit [Parapedobacter composti]SFB92367.1 multicomponent Na+:H+ antiporter subunit D [Parapedobacter composti]